MAKRELTGMQVVALWAATCASWGLSVVVSAPLYHMGAIGNALAIVTVALFWYVVPIVVVIYTIRWFSRRGRD